MTDTPNRYNMNMHTKLRRVTDHYFSLYFVKYAMSGDVSNEIFKSLYLWHIQFVCFDD
jgi:hypothetical protein